MRTAFPLVILVSMQMGLMDVLSAQSTDNQVSSDCTPTKTIPLDEPSADWRIAEQRDRDRYKSTARTILSGTAIAAMVERPQTVKQLLLNIKTAVDRDLLVQNGFYETPVLMKVLAASAISWQENQRSEGATQKIATLIFGKSALAGLHGYVKLVHSHVARHDVTPNSHVEEHDLNQGEISLRLDKSGMAIAVRTIVEIFGMPVLAHKGCGDSGFGHGLSRDDPTCKGQMIYTYSKRDLPSAILAINQTEFTVRLDAKERRSPTWDSRSAEGRKRFLCDEDELRNISVLQREY